MLAHGILPRVDWAMLRKGDRLRVQGVGPLSRMTRSAHGYPDQLHLDSLREHVARSSIRTPSGRNTRHSWTSHPDDSISYLDMLSGSWLKWASLPTAHVPPPSYPDALSGHLLLLVFHICLWQWTSKLRFFMFLSFPLLCHGFQRTLLNLGLLWW